MGEFFLKSIKVPLQKSSQENSYTNEISSDRYQSVLAKLSKVIPNGRAVYIFGMGKHPISTYSSLKNRKGIEVIWYGSLIPSYLFFLRFIIASYEGIIKVNDMEKIPDVFLRLSKASMVGLYVFDKSLEVSFVETIKNEKYSAYADSIIRMDKSHLIYQVDADSLESQTGIYEIVSFGSDCPSNLKNIVSSTS